MVVSFSSSENFMMTRVFLHIYICLIFVVLGDGLNFVVFMFVFFSCGSLEQIFMI